MDPDAPHPGSATPDPAGAGGAEPPGRRLAPRHASSPARPRSTSWTLSLVLVAVLAFAGSLAGFGVLRLQGNVRTVGDLGALIARDDEGGSTATPDTDAWEGRPLNFLVIGSDDRGGANGEIGGVVGGMRSDTALLVHVAADRSRVEVVSIPRDSEVRIPACHLDRDPAGRMSEPTKDKFNAAFSLGGASGDPGLAGLCTAATVAENTGIDVGADFAIVDFAGFEGMVDAIGGVRLCVPEAIRDTHRNTDLDLDAGWHDLTGGQALDYVRARYVTGSDNSDTQRIPRQQKFIGAVVRKVTSSDVLTSPRSVAGFLEQGTRALTLSGDLASMRSLAGLGWRMRGLDPEQVTFVTVPTGPKPGSAGRVLWTDDADLLWQRIAADEPVAPEPAPGSTSTPAPDATGDQATPGGGTPPAGTDVPQPAVTPRTAEDPDDVLCG
ncbi:LCP family protein [Cellulomonas chengniuliangii]|uniref:LCP family protein n=1 Tax=Cellulomonas chengniuliangii TaxID=2968084 RepID=UPI001D0DDFBA|nr:LCP family protein [Cellulomonas chengniuliangii]MCC2318134.1 LCP family protein [Cellulomonas chengniuliangii]